MGALRARFSPSCSRAVNALRVIPATENDVREIALRRSPDEEGRRLYVRLAQEAAAGAWVVRDEGTPIALAFARAYEDEHFVSELYVEPSFRGGGIGSLLFSEVLRAADGASVSALVEAGDAASLAFSVRRGVALHVPVLRARGRIPREEELAKMAVGDYRFAAVPIDPNTHRSALDALDRNARGTARADDHLWFSDAAHGIAFMLGEECIGYAYVWPNGRVGPMVVASNAYALQLFAFALASLRRVYGASWCTLLVPGDNLRIAQAVSRIGLTVEQVCVFASDQPIFDCSRYVGFDQLAF